MSVIPTALQIVGDQLEVTWSDDQVRQYAFSELRGVCPCATCREKRRADEEPAEAKDVNMLPIVSDADMIPLRIDGMQPVGNYAYTIKFSDGHDTGIYTFDFLRQLGREK